MRQNLSPRSRKIRGIVGSETELGILLGVFGNRTEKLSLHQPIFVMPALWPGIREEHEDALKNDRLWQCAEKFRRLRQEENKVGQLGPVTFAGGAFHPVTHNINAYAKLLRMRRRIIREEMPMTRTYLQGDARSRLQQLGQGALKIRATSVATGDVFGSSGGVIHARRLSTAVVLGASPSRRNFFAGPPRGWAREQLSQSRGNHSTETQTVKKLADSTTGDHL